MSGGDRFDTPLSLNRGPVERPQAATAAQPEDAKSR